MIYAKKSKSRGSSSGCCQEGCRLDPSRRPAGRACGHTKGDKETMSKIKQIFDKENELVKKNAREVHQDFYDAIQQARKDAGMSIGELNRSAYAGPAMGSRLKDPDANLTVVTMQRYAAAVGKKVKVELVDLGEEEIGA